MISFTGAMVGMKWLLVTVGYFAVLLVTLPPSWSNAVDNDLGVDRVVSMGFREFSTWPVTLDADDRYLSPVETELGDTVTCGEYSTDLEKRRVRNCDNNFLFSAV